MIRTSDIRRKYVVLEDAAQLLRLLAAVEHAHLVGNEERHDTLLGQVTPSVIAEIAVELDGLAQAARLAHAASRRDLLYAVAGVKASLPIPPAETAASDVPPQSLAAVIPLDQYSRKVSR